MPSERSQEFKWRRNEAIIRDDYTCQNCGAVGGPEGDAKLHAHHIEPVAEGGADDVDNLETLCKTCHAQQHRTGSTSDERALVTNREQEILLGDADVTEKYYHVVVTRVRKRIRRLEDELPAIESHATLGDELREVVCGEVD